VGTIRTNGVELYCEVHGDGPPFLLIAGLASDSQSWLPVIPALAKRNAVIACDNRGSGRTTPPDAEITIALLAEDCAALIERLGHRRVHVLGHSMGGLVAQALAAQHPELVDRLVLVGTAAWISKRNARLLRDMAFLLESGTDPAVWFRILLPWLFTRRFFENDAAVKEAVRYALEYPYPQSPDQFRRQVEAACRFEPIDTAQVRAETLVLTGAEDLLLPPDEGRRLAERLPNARFSTIAGAAHSIHMEAPDAFARAITQFLAE